MYRRARALTLLPVALVLALGCGSGESDRDDSGAPPNDATGRRSDIHYESSTEDLPDLAENTRDLAPRGMQHVVDGNWRRARVRSTDANLSVEDREMVRQLETLGYAEGSVEATQRGGVTINIAEQVAPGLNFLTSGHEPGALLIDSQGRVLHRWHRSLEEIWPDTDREPRGYWRRAHLFPNGDVLAIFEGQGIAKLTAESEIIWASDLRAHHDIFVGGGGDIFILTREVNRIEGILDGRPFLEDFIVILGPDGVEKRKVSVLRAFLESPHSDLLDPKASLMGDLLHTNSIEVLDGSIVDHAPEFAEGRILISMAVPAVLAVVDMDLERVVWAHKSDFKFQHDPKILASGSLMFFDNLGKKRFSRVLEIDPASRQRLWVYSGTRETPFSTRTCGTAQRMDNGNTLVTESDNGHAFEISGDGDIVWEYHSPYRAGPEQEFVATLFEVLRLPEEFPSGWADSSTAELK